MKLMFAPITRRTGNPVSGSCVKGASFMLCFTSKRLGGIAVSTGWVS
jgi:hypothetical protein